MNYSIYSSCWHDNFAIFHALKIRLILRTILLIAYGGFFGGWWWEWSWLFLLPYDIFSQKKKKKVSKDYKCLLKTIKSFY